MRENFRVVADRLAAWRKSSVYKWEKWALFGGMKLMNYALIGQELALAWDDGVEDYLPLEMLRRACPCAACQGEPDAMGHVVRPKVSWNERSFLLTKMEIMGGYALQPYWQDGHHTGLFSYNYLRELGQMLRDSA